MAGGSDDSGSLEETPTWAVAVVCLALVTISLSIDHVIYLTGKWLKKRHKSALYESLEKIKAELMLLGFISLLLTVGEGLISGICIPESVGRSWHPCKKDGQNGETSAETSAVNHQLFGAIGRRVLASGGSDKCEVKGKVPFISVDGIHQLHIFIFVLAFFHVLTCIITLALGQAKMRKWMSWESETKTVEYQYEFDQSRLRFTKDTVFGQRHLSIWSKSNTMIWIVCFFRQFGQSVPKVDYLTLRHGFITAHFSAQSTASFDFQKYIKRSLEEDFMFVVGISPVIWSFAVLFLLSNAHGWNSYLWLPFIPLIVVLLVGTKLQVIITRMGLGIQERGDVVRGVPVVEPTDNLFWFGRPRLILYLIHFILFQNAFQLSFFAWSWYEFGLRSCFHQKLEDIIVRVSMGLFTQFLCSYVTLPLYALVTQMGSKLRHTIFDEKVAAAMLMWYRAARKRIKGNKRSGSVTPLSTSRPGTPTHELSPAHLLRHYQAEVDSSHVSPRISYSDKEHWSGSWSVIAHR